MKKITLRTCALSFLWSCIGCGDGVIDANVLVRALASEDVAAGLSFPAVYTYSLAPKDTPENTSGSRIDRVSRVYCGLDNLNIGSLHVNTRCEELWLTVAVKSVTLDDPDLCIDESENFRFDPLTMSAGSTLAETSELVFDKKDCARDDQVRIDVNLELVD